MRVRYSFSCRHTRTLDRENQHRQPFPKIVKEMIDKSEIVVEVLDARFIEETRNPELEKHIKETGKKLIYAINKIDLINILEVKKKLDERELFPHVFISCRERKGAKNLRNRIKIEASKIKTENPKLHVGVIGYPNTGKSSVINFLTGRGSAKTAKEAGFTKGVQKIKLSDNILIWDTPGVIPEKELEAGNRRIKLAKIGVKAYDKVKDPDFFVAEIMKCYPGVFENFYGIKANGDSEMLIEELGRKRHLIKRGNEVDIDRTARTILKDWQDGKIKVA
jgi:hypothetical protein